MSRAPSGLPGAVLTSLGSARGRNARVVESAGLGVQFTLDGSLAALLEASRAQWADQAPQQSGASEGASEDMQVLDSAAAAPPPTAPEAAQAAAAATTATAATAAAHVADSSEFALPVSAKAWAPSAAAAEGAARSDSAREQPPGSLSPAVAAGSAAEAVDAAAEALFETQVAARSSLSVDAAILAAEAWAAEEQAGKGELGPAPDDWEALCEEGATLHFQAAPDAEPQEVEEVVEEVAPPMPVLLVNLSRLSGRDLASLCGVPPDYSCAAVTELEAKLSAALAHDLRARSGELFEGRAAVHSVTTEAAADLARERQRSPSECIVMLRYPEECGATGSATISLWADALARTEWPAVNLLKESLARCSQPLHWKSDVASELQRLADNEAGAAVERRQAQVKRHQKLASMHAALRERLAAQEAAEEEAEEAAEQAGGAEAVGDMGGYDAGAEEGGERRKSRAKKSKGAKKGRRRVECETDAVCAGQRPPQLPSQRTYAQLVRVERDVLAIEAAVESGVAAPDDALEEYLRADEEAKAAADAEAVRDGIVTAPPPSAQQAAKAARDMSLLDMVVATVFDSLPRPAELTEAQHFEALAARHRELRRLWLVDFGRLPPSARQQAKVAAAEEAAAQAKAKALALAEAEASEARQTARAEADRQERQARGAPALAMLGGLSVLSAQRDAERPTGFAAPQLSQQWGPPG